MPKISFSSDLEVLVSIFASNIPHLAVYDPGERLHWNSPKSFVYTKDITELTEHFAMNREQDFFVFNLSKEDLDGLYQLRNVHALAQMEVDSPQAGYQRFLYINNPNGTIRWVFPDSIQHPSFLNLYNSSGWRSQLYRMGLRFLFQIGRKESVCSGSFALRSKSSLQTDQLLRNLAHDHYSLFTGTTSASRKAILEVNQYGNSAWFLKIPIGKEAYKSLENEKSVLQAMKAYELNYSCLPKVRSVGNGVLLENIKPEKFSKSIDLESLHLKALSEWYANNSVQKNIQDLPVYQEINQHLAILQDFSGTIEKPFSQAQVEKVIHHLKELNENFQYEKPMALAWAHGDFTPWNMYRGAKQLHVYDWEMAREEMPLLFDAFHFVFQSGILIKRQAWKEIAQDLNKLKTSPEVQYLQAQYNFDFAEHLQFYLLYTVSYYLSRYLYQKPLHEQAGWLIDSWETALVKFGKKRKMPTASSVTKERVLMLKDSKD